MTGPAELPRRRVRLRRPYTRATAAELDAAAVITDADIERARVTWRRHAPGTLRRLLDAKPQRAT